MIATVVLVLRLLLTALLYVFLGWALWSFWQDLRIQGKNFSQKKKIGITVTQKLDQGKERQVRFFQQEIIIGRHTHCDLSVMDEALSAQHARLRYHHRQWWLEDLSSSNGTFLNGTKLNTPAVVITDDQFKCGNTDFSLRVESEDETDNRN